MAELYDYFKSVVDQSRSQVIVCDLEHKILYMNPVAAERQKKNGGYDLLGKSLLACHNPNSVKKIQEVVEWFKADKEHNVVHSYYKEKDGKDVYIVALRDGDGELIGYFERHEFRIKDDTKLYDLY